MRFSPTLWLCLGLVVSARATPLEDEVRFWAVRAERDPADAISPTRQGEACLKLIRATALTEWETKGEAALRTALARNPEHVPALVALSSLCLRRHAFDEAAKWADEAVRLTPEQADALAARGDVRLELGRLAEARADFNRVAEKVPGLAAQSRLARLRFLEGHPAEAATLLEQALAGAPSDVRPGTLAMVELQLGELRFRSGDFERAEALYRQAQQHAPELPAVLDHQAELQAAQGQSAAARTLFETLANRTRRPEYHQAVGDLLKQAQELFGALSGSLHAEESGGTTSAPAALFDPHGRTKMVAMAAIARFTGRNLALYGATRDSPVPIKLRVLSPLQRASCALSVEEVRAAQVLEF